MTKTPDEIKKGLEWDEVDESLRKIRFDDAGEVVEWKPKTSTDTKNGLLCCTIEGGCNDCPYQQDCFQTDGFSELAGDALALIQQYEKTIDNLAEANAAVHKKCDSLRLRVENREESLRHLNNLRDAAAGRALEMEERVHQLEAERDAAVEIIKKKVGCEACKCYGLCTVPLPDCGECVHENCPCHTCCGRSNWQWRGVHKEDTP